MGKMVGLALPIEQPKITNEKKGTKSPRRAQNAPPEDDKKEGGEDAGTAEASPEPD